ncbi:predicted protein [Thalassiosira pseudonana CCMP1335]|uniref:Uncharacterized protein n=1 Tax=Thalassiosira pseudonana TaxID=35128 RepID=B8C6L0_THAPS|nr:predicted protein [Thalassiosira pseudonana CCMP1335]EED90823.1 predicted protein [Thalassiosira pseudonana CCMP1335]
MILCNIALVGPGLRSVQNASTSTRKLTRDVEDLMTQGLLIMDSVSRAQTNIEALDVESVLHVEDACPNLADNAFVSNAELQSSIAKLESEFNNLKDYIDGKNFENMRNSIDLVMKGTDVLDTAATTVEMNDWAVKMFALILNVLVCFMMISTMVSLAGKNWPALRCIVVVIMFPVFAVLVAMGWVATGFFGIVSVSNADFCSGDAGEGGVEGTINNIFHERGVSADSIIFKSVLYYQSGCTTEDPIDHLYKYEDIIQSGIGSAETFLTQSDEIGIDVISNQCGALVTPIIEGVGLVKDNLGILLGAFRSTFELASCSRVGPVYRQAFDGVACTDSAGGLTMLFALLFTIGVIGMAMITLRSAMYPAKLVYASPDFQLPEEEEEWEDYQAYLRYMSDFFTGGQQRTGEEGVSIQKDSTEDTSSESSWTEDTPVSFIRTNVHSQSVDEVYDAPSDAPSLPPPINPSFDSTYHSPDMLESMSSDEVELVAMSPTTSQLRHRSVMQTPAHSVMFTPPAKAFLNETVDEECQPLSPNTPVIANKQSSGSRDARLLTPDFLSPGTFRRWRRQDEEDVVSVDSGLPPSPMVSSPRDNTDGGSSYFSNFITPLRRGGRTSNKAE